MAGILQFDPFVSRIDAGFWHELAQRKLEKYKLSEEQQPIRGCYGNGNVPGFPTQFTLEYTAFTDNKDHLSYAYPSSGAILNTNTIDSFKNFDKKKLLESLCSEMWENMCSGATLKHPNMLNQFFLLTFSDLKKYNFYYWFTFPALQPEEPFTSESTVSVGNEFTSNQLNNLAASFNKFRATYPGVGYFCVVVDKEEVSLHPLAELVTLKTNSKLEIETNPRIIILLGFCDPSTSTSNPGWPLRNLLMLASKEWGDVLSSVDVLCYREYTREGKRVNSHSLVVKGIPIPNYKSKSDIPKGVGWERNEKSKLQPKMVNLSSSMDPIQLSESSVDMNLKLMKWRLLPSLDLQAIAQTKCLLLGSGTLGCNVARCLLGWGVRNITLVDNGTVSYSNPVRQSLFTFKDCSNGGRGKAEAAAESLRLIFPGINAQGIVLSIPMPGHSVGSSEDVLKTLKEDVKKLEELISSHDAVFLLMDTRESRWLPTVLCASMSKICINAALGFDTYMVMRHGFRPPTPIEEKPEASSVSRRICGSELACYFCSDVVAPTNSTRDRTLDQQCTVSRPGLSMIAGALAVELLMCILQHPKRGLAHSENLTDDDECESDSILGLVPHQIRGFMSRFSNVLPASSMFDKCTACSKIVLQHYHEGGFEFLLNAFNSPNFLEDLTGLSELYAQTFEDQVWEFNVDETCS